MRRSDKNVDKYRKRDAFPVCSECGENLIPFKDFVANDYQSLKNDIEKGLKCPPKHWDEVVAAVEGQPIPDSVNEISVIENGKSRIAKRQPDGSFK